jgi:WD40 repeat protein
MIPEHRLATLLTSIQQQQILSCQYHNTTVPPSLYTEHECTSKDFPLQTLTELRNQTDEVWYLEFSHDGSMLATAGKDGLVNVYDTKRWMIVHEFREHERNALEARGVCYVAFSPDDRYLISCSQNNEFVVMDVRDGRVVCKADHFDYPVTAAAWLPDSIHFVVGTQSSRRPLGLYSLRASNGNGPSSTPPVSNSEVHSWREPLWETGGRENGTSFRVTDVAVSRDGTRMAAATTDNRIMTYDLRSRNKVDEWPMEDKITSINYSADNTLLLVNMNDSEINMGKLWTLDSTTGEEVMRYEGASQAEFVIRSCFGGAGENFVMSGSEGELISLKKRYGFEFDRADTFLSQTHTSTSGAAKQAPKSPLLKPIRPAQSTLWRGILPTLLFSRAQVMIELFACKYPLLSCGTDLPCGQLLTRTQMVVIERDCTLAVVKSYRA